MSDIYLVHHGVKGMKWGVRHDRPRGHFTYQTTKHTTGDGKQTTAVGYTKKNGKFTGVMVTRKQLTEKQKKALKIAAGVTAAGVLAAVGYVGIKQINRANLDIAEKQIKKHLTNFNSHSQNNLFNVTDYNVTKSAGDILRNSRNGNGMLGSDLERRYTNDRIITSLKYSDQVRKMAKNDKLSTKVKNIVNTKRGKEAVDYVKRADTFNARTGQRTISEFTSDWEKARVKAAKKAGMPTGNKIVSRSGPYGMTSDGRILTLADWTKRNKNLVWG